MSPGDRPGLPLETEPLPFLHPRVAGTAAPRHDVGGRQGIALEEEPALWVEHDPSVARQPLPPGARGPGGGGGAEGVLPVTGARATGGAALFLLGIAWVLRRRARAAGR